MKAKSLYDFYLPHSAHSHAMGQGFDEFMNIVVNDAAEIYVKEAKARRELGK